MGRPASETAVALTALAAALGKMTRDLEQLAGRAERLAVAVEGGQPLHELMEGEERPLIVTRLVEITDLLHDRGGDVRRAEARQLRDEGHTHEQIAEIFGVSRQRAGALLRPPPAERRLPKRPRPRDL